MDPQENYVFLRTMLANTYVRSFYSLHKRKPPSETAVYHAVNLFAI